MPTTDTYIIFTFSKIFTVDPSVSTHKVLKLLLFSA